MDEVDTTVSASAGTSEHVLRTLHMTENICNNKDRMSMNVQTRRTKENKKLNFFAQCINLAGFLFIGAKFVLLSNRSNKLSLSFASIDKLFT